MSCQKASRAPLAIACSRAAAAVAAVTSTRDAANLEQARRGDGNGLGRCRWPLPAQTRAAAPATPALPPGRGRTGPGEWPRQWLAGLSARADRSLQDAPDPVCSAPLLARRPEEDISGFGYKAAGVDIDAGARLVEAIKPLAAATRRSGGALRPRRLRRAVRPQGDRLPRSGPGRRHRRRRHQAEDRDRQPAATTPSASTWSPCASTTWSSRAPSRCSSSTISPPAGSTSTTAATSSPASPRAAQAPAAR